MRAARIHQYGDPNVIRIDDIPRPMAEAGQVLIQVAATSLNPSEVGLRSGVLREILPTDLPLTLGWDVTGTIVEVGAGTHTHAVGDHVFGMIGAAAAEFAVADADAVVAAPTSLPHADAAAIPVAGMTAWQAIQRAELVAGERVLVNGAGGGIGGFAAQLAKHAGAEVIATASPRSTQAVLRHGADRVIDYTTTPLADAINGQLDVIVNIVNLDQEQSTALGALVRPGGRIVSVTNTIEAPPGVDSTYFVVRNNATDLAALAALVDTGALTVDISERHPLGELSTLHHRCEAGDLRGKVVIHPTG